MQAREYVQGQTYDPAIFKAIADMAQSKLEGKELATKRPKTSMRLVIDDWNILNFKPEIKSSPTGWKMGDHIRVELRSVAVFMGRPGNGRGIAVHLLPDGSIKPKSWWKNPDKTKHEMELITQYLGKLASDPRGTISQNVTHCAFCGRAFTDPVSMARGVGPECVKIFDFFIQHSNGVRENG